MKKNYLLWALAVVSLAGCSQNEITEVSPDAHPAVGFSVYTGTQARGAETDLDAVKTSGFGILAYYTGTSDMSSASSPTPNFMWNQQVTYDTSGKVWKYTPLKYWPNTTGDKVSFFAYAPYLSDQTTSPKIKLSGNTATGYPTIKFTVAEANNAVDLVAAKKENETKPTSADSKVTFSLKHVLTKATFKAKLSTDYYSSSSDNAKKTKIYLTGASLVANGSTGLYSYATYKFENEKWDYTTGSDDSDKAALMSTDYSLASILNLASISGGLEGYSKSAIEITSSSSETTLFKNNESLYLIPANNDSGTSSDKKVQVQLEYDIVTADTNLSGNSSVVPCKVTVDLTTGTLKQNAAYTYTFILGLTEVKVEASMDTDGWTTTDGNKDVDVPTKPVNP